MNKRDHTKMICDIGELSGLFQDSSSLEVFLQKIVEMVAIHMHSGVCSIYLYDEKEQMLVMRANKGFSPSAIGTVKLAMGEGLTGIAVKEMRPICRRKASESTGYRYFANIGEETYESFLAVPILHGLVRIGAIVIQNVQVDYFDEEDIKALRAISAQLANTIEMAKLLMDIEDRRKLKPVTEYKKELKLLKGKVGAHGFAVGRAVVLDNILLKPSVEESILRQKFTLEDFHTAVLVTEQQLELLQEQLEEHYSDVASLIFAAQILMLKDTAFVGAIEQLIEEGTHPIEAVSRTIDGYVQLFDNLSNEYLREKKQDIQDVGRRLIRNMIGVDDKDSELTGCIIIADELFPSDIIKLFSRHVKGLVLLTGGIASHLSILSRSLGIPLIIVGEKQLLNIPEKARLLIDGELGEVHVNPDEVVVETYLKKEKDKTALEKDRPKIRHITLTRDGQRIKLLSNINLLEDATIAKAMCSEGIGLYRTEFPFLVRSSFPSEEEQYLIYRKLTDIMPDKEVTFRTLDIGGDKIISYYDYGKEKNPFLGMRSIRFSLRHKDVFVAQLRAILRAGVDRDLRIMFPMISSLDELLQAKAIVFDCIDRLGADKIAHNDCPKIGIMIELPAVLEIIDVLAQEADFFSIGTNDFIQYMLAVDRTNERISDIFLPHHPSILRSLHKIVAAGQKNKISVSVCGDMVHEYKYIPYLLGIGIRELSLDARRLPKIQEFIEHIDIPEVAQMTQKILQYNTVSDVEYALQEDIGMLGRKKHLDKT